MNNLFAITFSFLLLLNFSEPIIAQSNDGQLWSINTIKVEPANSEAFERAGIKGTEVLKEANVSNTFYISSATDQNEYFISMPIENMAELDKSFWAEAVSKLGVEKFTKLLMPYSENIKESKIDIYRQQNELDYRHASLKGVDLNFVEWIIYEFNPNDAEKVYALQKEWIDLFKKKDIVRMQLSFRGIIGPKAGTIVAVEYAKDRATQAQQHADFLKKGGAEAQALWERTEALIVNIESRTGRPLHDMSIYPPAPKATLTPAKKD